MRINNSFSIQYSSLQKTFGKQDKSSQIINTSYNHEPFSSPINSTSFQLKIIEDLSEHEFFLRKYTFPIDFFKKICYTH